MKKCSPFHLNSHKWWRFSRSPDSSPAHLFTSRSHRNQRMSVQRSPPNTRPRAAAGQVPPLAGPAGAYLFANLAPKAVAQAVADPGSSLNRKPQLPLQPITEWPSSIHRWSCRHRTRLTKEFSASLDRTSRSFNHKLGSPRWSKKTTIAWSKRNATSCSSYPERAASFQRRTDPVEWLRGFKRAEGFNGYS